MKCENTIFCFLFIMSKFKLAYKKKKPEKRVTICCLNTSTLRVILFWNRILKMWFKKIVCARLTHNTRTRTKLHKNESMRRLMFNKDHTFLVWKFFFCYIITHYYYLLFLLTVVLLIPSLFTLFCFQRALPLECYCP